MRQGANMGEPQYRLEGIVHTRNDGLEDFAADIATIPSGGGGESQPRKDVNFYDYDGVRIFSYSKEEANSLTELPTPPLKDDLNFTGWTYSLQAIKDQVGKCDIGALYSYNNPDYFVALTILVPSDNFTIKFRDAFYKGEKLDWGDGNVIENQSSILTNKT